MTPVKHSSQVFLSYASQDVAVADSIVQNLESHGIGCWIAPRDVTPGEIYADAIVRGLSAARTLVLVLTQHSANSQHVLRELERASSKRHSIVALRIGPVQLPPAFEYFLSASHWLDTSEADIHRALPKLVAAVAQLTSTQRSDAGVAPPTANLVRPLEVARFSKRLGGRAVVAAVGVAVIVASIAGFQIWKSKSVSANHAEQTAVATISPPATPVSEKSVAVLPFADMSENKDQEYFADGMAEEIISILAQAPDLFVTARTSSFYFKDKPTPVTEIGRQLRVAHVLEGSVRKSATHLRVTTQLIRTSDGYHVWSQSYDRDLNDVFKIQDEIGNAVAQALQISLKGGPLTRPYGGTQSLEAYQLYLRALNAHRHNNRASLEAARAYLDLAVQIDSNFGLAWNELGFNYVARAEARLIPANEGFTRARELLLRATALSPDMAEAHSNLAYVHMTYDFDWRAAGEAQRRALALSPENPEVLLTAGILATILGHWNEAERQLNLAKAKDPLSGGACSNLASALYGARKFALAEKELRELLARMPDFLWTRYYLVKALLLQKKHEEAQQILAEDPDPQDRYILWPIILQDMGRPAEANAAIETLLSKSSEFDAYYIAMVYAHRNDAESAVSWLERAYTNRNGDLQEILGEPLFDPIARDPHYRAFLRKIGLAQ